MRDGRRYHTFIWAGGLLRSVMSRIHIRPNEPQAAASYLLYLLLTKVDREAIPGDLEQEYRTTILPKFGPTCGWFWYWWQTFVNIAWRNPLCRWLLVGGGFAKATEWLWRHIAR